MPSDSRSPRPFSSRVFNLCNRVAHVWRVWPNAADADRCKSVLDDVERSRAVRLSGPARDRYVAGQAIVRTILGRYLGMAPGEIAFVRKSNGKPALRAHQASNILHFNVSHSGDVLLLAVARREVGIDVEACDRPRAVSELAARIFSKPEIAALAALPERARTRAFYAAWTRKEAFAKATGEGLAMPFNAFTVTVGADQPARLITGCKPDDIDRWSMTSLPVGEAYEATIVVDATIERVHCWDWMA